MSVFVYVNTSKQVGDPDHLKVFTNRDAAAAWLAENDPEGVAFEYWLMAAVPKHTFSNGNIARPSRSVRLRWHPTRHQSRNSLGTN
jgi:hypothetical protein